MRLRRMVGGSAWIGNAVVIHGFIAFSLWPHQRASFPMPRSAGHFPNTDFFLRWVFALF